jgi:hypothetical protein
VAALATGDDGYMHGTGRLSWHIPIVADQQPMINTVNGYIRKPISIHAEFKWFRNFGLG